MAMAPVDNRIRSNALMGFHPLCRSLRVNPIKVLAMVGLPSSVLRSGDLMISYNAFADMFNVGADRADFPLFGLAMSSYQGLKTFGPLGMLAGQCDTVADSLEVIQKYFHFHASGVTIEVDVQGNETHLNVDIAIDPTISRDQLFELSMGLGYNVLSEMAPARMSNAKVLFRHSPMAPLEEYAKYTAAQLLFDQDRYGIVFPTATLADPPQPPSEEIRSYFESYINEASQQQDQPVPHKVSKLIYELISTGEATITTIAPLLNMHVRALQRELTAAGTDFRTLLDNVRFELAREALLKGQAITDLALNLGYSELSAFSRAFKRWSGETPQQWQRTHRA